MRQPIVSVIIPCFNAQRYLDETIRSVLDLSYPRVELIIVDDGSEDETARIARSYSQALYLHQSNQGTGSARNAGFRHSTGEYIIFLDADDRLLSNAVEAGLEAFRAYPDSGLVWGRYRKIDARGLPITPPTERRTYHDVYAAFLQQNLIGHPAIVLYPRHVVEHLQGFSTQFNGCEDYDLYLRVSREFSVHQHDCVIAEYRQHEDNVSRNHRLMLEVALRVLRGQEPYVARYPRYRPALQNGLSNWRRYYGQKMSLDLRHHVTQHGFSHGFFRRFRDFAYSYPEGLATLSMAAVRKAARRGFTAQN